jgi:cytochrome bd-type quinol oxidase subunit 2
MKRAIALAAVIGLASTVSIAAGGKATVTGQYVEARTAEVFTGGCIMGSEAETMGKQAVLAWKVDRGTVNGVSIDGLSVVAALAVAGFLSWTVAVAVDRNDKSVFPPVLPAALAIAAVALALLFVALKRHGWAFAATAVATVGWVATIFTSLYPRVMVSSPNFGNSLTVDGAASAHYTLEVMTVVAAIFVPLVLVYQGWTYHVFRARVGGDEVEAAPAGGSPAA